ncbi:MAG: ferredoxin [Chloroflexi bacterium RBG_16_50_9]|nr:MAG: ferredoxin [Chloroflexi bacterium RBG_16_50_9]
MKPVSLTINGQEIAAREGEKLLWAALDNGIYIPNLCALRDKPEPEAACRLCFVEVDGNDKPVTACTEDIREGMVVNTRGEKSLKLARAGFDLLMASHKVDCAHCAANRSCELQKIARHLGCKLKTTHLRQLLRNLPVDDSNPFFIYDPNKCVLCGRCVYISRQRLKTGVLGYAHRGFERMVTTFADEPIGADRCLECDELVSVCPTGALSYKDGQKAAKDRAA